MQVKFIIAVCVALASVTSACAQTGSTTTILYWPKLMDYVANASGYADVPGHSRHNYVVSGSSGQVVTVSLVKSTLLVHTATAVSSEINIPITLNEEGEWTRQDSLWLMTSLPVGTYSSKAESELTIGGVTTSSNEPSSFRVIELAPEIIK